MSAAFPMRTRTPSIVVLEGVDGSGKSTIAQALKNHLEDTNENVNHVEIVHNGPPEYEGQDQYVRHEQQIQEADFKFRRSGIVTIFDRMHLGAVIYGKRLRGKSDLTLSEVRELDLKIASAGGRRILCKPGFRTVQTRFSARGDDLIDANMLSELYEDYSALVTMIADRYQIGWWHCIDTNQTISKTIKEILR